MYHVGLSILLIWVLASFSFAWASSNCSWALTLSSSNFCSFSEISISAWSSVSWALASCEFVLDFVFSNSSFCASNSCCAEFIWFSASISSCFAELICKLMLSIVASRLLTEIPWLESVLSIVNIPASICLRLASNVAFVVVNSFIFSAFSSGFLFSSSNDAFICISWVFIPLFWDIKLL